LGGTLGTVEAYAHGRLAEERGAKGVVLIAKELAHGVFELSG
jgi:hypothetical protein